MERRMGWLGGRQGESDKWVNGQNTEYFFFHPITGNYGVHSHIRKHIKQSAKFIITVLKRKGWIGSGVEG